MSEEDGVWREGDPKWVWPEGESVPRYVWMQVSQSEVVRLLNEHCHKPVDAAHEICGHLKDSFECEVCSPF